jgi:hypothetical protein
VAASLHGVLLPVGAVGLSYQVDQSQGVRSVIPAAEEARTYELARLDALAEAIAPKVKAGDIKAVHTAIRIGESRRRLLGLDAPVKIDANVTVMPAEVIDLVAEVRQRLAGTLTRTDQPALPAPEPKPS